MMLLLRYVRSCWDLGLARGGGGGGEEEEEEGVLTTSFLLEISLKFKKNFTTIWDR